MAGNKGEWPMSTTCRNCGTAVDADDTFCGNCGAAATAGQPALAAPASRADSTRLAYTEEAGGGEAYRMQEQGHQEQGYQEQGYAPPLGPGSGYPGQPAGYSLQAQPEARADSRSFLASLFDFSFTSYVTPKVIRVLYILAVIWFGLVAFGLVIGGFVLGGPVGGLFTLIIVAPLYYLWTLLLYRITLEFFMLIFRIAEDIRALRLRGELR
jgi:hypothetical protein